MIRTADGNVMCPCASRNVHRNSSLYRIKSVNPLCGAFDISYSAMRCTLISDVNGAVDFLTSSASAACASATYQQAAVRITVKARMMYDFLVPMIHGEQRRTHQPNSSEMGLP